MACGEPWKLSFQEIQGPGLIVKNPVLPHGASSKEKAILAIHPRSSERGILAFSRELSETEVI
jgi:hypothetical protein